MSLPLVHPSIVVTDRVARAAQFVGFADYRLGKGGRDPSAPQPGDENNQLDCSGFQSYVDGDDRLAVMPIEMAKKCNLDYDVADGMAVVYYNCANMVNDALGKYHHRYRAVLKSEQVEPGDVLVRKPRAGQAHGHTARVKLVSPDFQAYRGGKKGWGKRCTIIHCSSWRLPPDIRETNAQVFENAGDAYFIRHI